MVRSVSSLAREDSDGYGIRAEESLAVSLLSSGGAGCDVSG